MNPVGSLHLATHDEGVAAIANFPLAIDWLAIAFPPIIDNVPGFPTPQPIPPHAVPQHPLHPPAPIRPPQPDPISKNQATSALVRHYRPYSAKEVLAPCFRVAERYILGRTLGNLFVPAELGIPQLANERCADARFVLDLQNGSIVEVRQYPAAKTLLCIAYASLRAEFVSLLPHHGSRVEITYRRDHSVPTSQADVGQVFENLPRGDVSQTSWHHFCINYHSIFPTGPLTATVTSQPGSATATFKKESIMVTVNDQYAMSFSSSAQAARAGASQARRIAPKRLLPRPTT